MRPQTSDKQKYRRHVGFWQQDAARRGATARWIVCAIREGRKAVCKVSLVESSEYEYYSPESESKKSSQPAAGGKAEPRESAEQPKAAEKPATSGKAKGGESAEQSQAEKARGSNAAEKPATGGKAKASESATQPQPQAEKRQESASGSKAKEKGQTNSRGHRRRPLAPGLAHMA